MTRHTRNLLAAVFFAAPAAAQDLPLPVVAPPVEAPSALPAVALRPVPRVELPSFPPAVTADPQPALLNRPYEALPQPAAAGPLPSTDAPANILTPPAPHWNGPHWRWYGWGAAAPVPPFPGTEGPAKPPAPGKPIDEPKKDEKDKKAMGLVLPPPPPPLTVLPPPVPDEGFRPVTATVPAAKVPGAPAVDFRLDMSPKPGPAPQVHADPLLGASAAPTWKTVRASSDR